MSNSEKIALLENKISKAKEKIIKEQDSIKKWGLEVESLKSLAIQGWIKELDMPFEEIQAQLKNMKKSAGN